MLGIEFFSGKARITAALNRLGHHVLSVDLFCDANIRRDILCLSRDDIITALGGEPEFMWFSPPCTGFSVASIGKHWDKSTGVPIPKTPTAHMGICLLRKTLEIISWFPKAKFCIENPRGMMRTMPELQHIKRHTISFCQYGEQRMKPTDIWTNLESWTPRPMCKNRAPCHESAPRGSRTGTQGIKGAYDRGGLPFELCEEIAEAVTSEVH